MSGRTYTKEYCGDQICGECGTNKAELVEESVSPFGGNYNVNKDYFCRECFSTVKKEDNEKPPLSPEVIDEARQMMLDVGMDAKEVQRMIMNMLNSK